MMMRFSTSQKQSRLTRIPPRPSPTATATSASKEPNGIGLSPGANWANCAVNTFPKGARSILRGVSRHGIGRTGTVISVIPPRSLPVKFSSWVPKNLPARGIVTADPRRRNQSRRGWIPEMMISHFDISRTRISTDFQEIKSGQFVSLSKLP